jgi:hypothetical protein
MEPMSIVVRFPAGEATPEQYEEVFRRIRESGNWPPDGLDSEIWDSREQFGAFDEHLIPVLTDVGIPVSEPEMFEVHYIFKR